MHLRLELVVLCLLPGLALAQARSLTVVPHPLEFDPRPELVSSADKLRAAWVEAVREAGEVVTPSRKELDAALSDVGRKDCRTSNDCLAALAVKGAGLYAVHALVELSELGVFTVTARVVRDDGRLMASFTTQAPRGDKKKPVAPLVKQLLVDVVTSLGIKSLPAFKEAVAAPPPVVASPAAVVSAPPPPPPVMPAVESAVPTTGSGQRVAAWALLGAGGAAVVTGAVLVGLGQAQVRALGLDARGFFPAGDADEQARAVASVRAATSLQTAGVVTLAAGAALAVTGLVLRLVEPAAPVTLVPLPGGGLVAVGGVW
ncbi:MAG: hypothetical protein MUC96_10260 [Myxococcaceae bacterium]|jgi:hypothetical protein|nr:hypothetical protein [Myxococcaceae bacterium]